MTTAKRLVQGRVGIDMIAGPSEVLVLADDSANPEWLAADMLSQAEHDALASAICITDNEALAHDVIAELERQSATLPRADIVRKSLADWSADRATSSGVRPCPCRPRNDALASAIDITDSEGADDA